MPAQLRLVARDGEALIQTPTAEVSLPPPLAPEQRPAAARYLRLLLEGPPPLVVWGPPARRLGRAARGRG